METASFEGPRQQSGWCEMLMLTVEYHAALMNKLSRYIDYGPQTKL